MRRLLFALGLVAMSSSAWALDNFELRWMNNVEDTNAIWKSADHQNSVIVVEAYFKDCPYCNDNAPNVDELAATYQTNPLVQVIDVGRDCRESDYATWISRHHPNHPVLNDCNTQVLGPLGISGYPTTVILDCHLHEVYRTSGEWGSSTAAAIRNKINQLLQTNCQ